MRDSNRASLLGIINKMTLGIVRRIFANYFDGVLVGPNSAILSKSVKYSTYDVVLFDIKAFIPLQAGMADVIVDSDSEMVLWR